MKILIDGYNLIFAWGWMPQSNHWQTSQQARAKLIRKLKQWIPSQQRRAITLVFDVKSENPAAHLVSGTDPSGFEILFARGYPDADTLIEELIRKESAPQHLAVVSSDQRIITAALRRKSIAVRSEDFLDEIPTLLFENTPKRRQDSDSPVTDRKVNFPAEPAAKQSAIDQLAGVDWLAEFGLNGERDTESSSPAAIPSGKSNDQAGQKPRASKIEPPQLPDGLNPFPPGYGEDLLEDETKK